MRWGTPYKIERGDQVQSHPLPKKTICHGRPNLLMPKRQGNCSSEDGHSVVSGHDSGTDHKQVNNCRPNRAQAPLTESHSIEIVCDFSAEVRYVG
jgi:hypothetical protein